MAAALEAAGFTPLEVHRFIAPAASTALIDALSRGGIKAGAAAALVKSDGSGLAMELEPKVRAGEGRGAWGVGRWGREVGSGVWGDGVGWKGCEPFVEVLVAVVAHARAPASILGGRSGRGMAHA